MTKKTNWQGMAIAAAVLLVSGTAAAEVRTWTVSGKQVDAEFVSASNGQVRLKPTDGAELTVPVGHLSEADRALVKTLTANASRDAASANKTFAKLAQQFYGDLRTDSRDEARGLLTDAAKALAKDGKSPLTGLPSPDPGANAIKPGIVKIDGDLAELPVQVRVDGEVQKTTLHMRKESDQWRAFAISAVFDDGEKTIDFEVASLTKGETTDSSALVGRKLDLSGYTLQGQPLDMSQFEGKVVLVDFWATWCAPCRAEMVNIFANWQQYHDAGFEVIAISVDRDMDMLKRFCVDTRPPWTIVADYHPKNRESMGIKYGVRSIPALILLDREGKVVAINGRGQKLGQQLAQLLGPANGAAAAAKE